MKTITLATLDSATEQEVFDFVANHLLTQNERSSIDSRCLYRGPNNLKCAAGALIAEDEYKPSFDESLVGCDWKGLVTKDLVPRTHQGLIEHLQFIHDHKPVNNWYEDLEKFTKTYNLDFTFIREKFPQA
jgi:hypothetical protein